ncbi:hypothetical protein Tsubulata_042499 [Turnera subulata]|uniref:Growth-regulating factor n=1 Tax=Turnera subulata TaxID=218843 RepID=A0A9Q0FKV5_9ROSI|nr:hypothetical protein Tsubulata_042499 [Turnera subulata]
MDLHLKQWRNQHESEQPTAKMPKLVLDPHPPHQNPPDPSGSPALPLFVPESNTKFSNLSAFSDSTAAATTRIPRMGSYFSLAQWQELELQALIYRYMLAGAAVPPELLHPIKKSLLHSPPYYLHHPLQHYSYCQPALLQTGYWGRGALDPEPGRCRRTDGKKWRCSRDVVAGQKYCERHVHRGRNRSRKPVEIPTPTTATTTISSTTALSVGGVGGGAAGAGGGAAGFSSTAAPVDAPALVTVAGAPNFSLSGQPPSMNVLHPIHSSSSDSRPQNKGLLGPQGEADGRPNGHILRHFFDDWPRPIQESDTAAGSNASPINSTTCLSISMPGNHHPSSDVSLKLSTGDGEDPGPRANAREQSLLNWGAGWGTNQVASMGGPLAEALRSSTSNSSPTSVLHQLPRRSASEASYVTT